MDGTRIALIVVLAVLLWLIRHYVARRLIRGSMSTTAAAAVFAVFFGSLPLVAGITGISPLNVVSVALSVFTAVMMFVFLRPTISRLLKGVRPTNGARG